MHTRDNDVCLLLLSDCPESLLGCLALIELALDKDSIATLRIGIDLGLILLLNELWLVLEWQVVLLLIRDGAHVELVSLGAEESLHSNRVGQLTGLTAIDAHEIVMAALSRLIFLHHK